YRANGSDSLGEVAARWLCLLRTWPWVALEGGGFDTVSATYARTPTAVALLDPVKDLVCAWDAEDREVERALGFQVDVPGSVVLRSLRDVRAGDAQLPPATACVYYEHLAGDGSTTPDLATAFDEGLVYSPGRRRW